MAMPKVLDWLDDLVAKVATNTTNIANNRKDIDANKKILDDHMDDDTRHWTTTDRQNFDRVVHFKGYFTTEATLKGMYQTAQVGDYAIVGETDTVWLWDDATNTWLNSTEQGIVISVNGRTGEVILTKTDVGLSNVDNTSDKNKPISDATKTALDNKADRKLVTKANVDSLTLRAGIYHLDDGTDRTILGFTARHWTVIVGEQSASGGLSATQIWMPYTTSTTNEPKMFLRKQVSNISWSDFVEVLTSTHLATLNADITQMKANIKTNADDIDVLERDKADRKKITVAQADSLDLRAGIYEIYNESKTIKNFTDIYWTVIVGENTGNVTKYSANQIWYNWGTGKESHIFIRHQASSNGSKVWDDFIEVLTSKHFTSTEISRVKQYKGYFATVQALETAFTTATNGDYAIVENALYIWDSKINRWTEVSGSGGSTGTGKWSVRVYNTLQNDNSLTPKVKDIIGKKMSEQWEVEDTADYIINGDLNDKCVYLFETYINMKAKTSITTTINHTDGMTIYLNDNLQYSINAAGTTNETFDFVKGWNKIQILVAAYTGNEAFKFGTKLQTNSNCLLMDCYHAETELTQGYVPLVGDSIIEGNIQVEGTIGVSSNSYLRYNEDDNSLSFIFENNMAK